MRKIISLIIVLAFLTIPVFSINYGGRTIKGLQIGGEYSNYKIKLKSSLTGDKFDLKVSSIDFVAEGGVENNISCGLILGYSSIKDNMSEKVSGIKYGVFGKISVNVGPDGFSLNGVAKGLYYPSLIESSSNEVISYIGYGINIEGSYKINKNFEPYVGIGFYDDFSSKYLSGEKFSNANSINFYLGANYNLNNEVKINTEFSTGAENGFTIGLKYFFKMYK